MKNITVEDTSRFTLEYQEDGRTITIEQEAGFKNGKDCMLVHANSFNSWDDGEPITEEQKKVILENIIRVVAEEEPNFPVYIID